MLSRNELINKYCNRENCESDCSDCPEIEYFEFLEQEDKELDSNNEDN